MAVKRVKESTIDTAFSILLRESYDWRCQFPNCEKCGNHDLRNGGLECSHYYGRRYRGGRWHPDNCIALCHGIHAYIDTHPSRQVDLMRRHLGDTRHDMLVERMQETFKYTPAQKLELHHHYSKDEAKRIKALRMDGVVGHIPIVSYD